jgi:hypothetical protein
MPSTAKDHLDARLRQISLFLPNRLGALRRAIDVLERGDVRIGGISVLEAADHAVVRFVVDRPEHALKSLEEAGYGGSLTDILGVSLSAGPRFGMQRVLSVLLSAEVSIMYVYGLILSDHGQPILALRADDLDLAARVLEHGGFRVLGQDDLSWPSAPE